MYHTFQAATASSAGEGENNKPSRPSGGSRRISTSNACVECPRLVEKLQSQVDSYHSVFARLFPGRELEEFLSLPREGLINLAVTLPISNASPNDTTDNLRSASEDVQKPECAESLGALEQAPDQDPESDEAMRLHDKIQGISDDVNGLSLSVDKASSYVGISSINAAMKVVLKTAPVARNFLSQHSAETTEPSRNSSPAPYARDPDPLYIPPPELGERLIDSYFAHIHLFMPMVDEELFRNTYAFGNRKDSPWLALLNVVMALGCLASSTCDNEDHLAFYQRARKHMELETLGSSSIMMLQALGLLSGYYLHWLNRPNEANGLMGATLRMATANGLHREYTDGSKSNSGAGTTFVASSSEVPAEIRRRTWWSLYCLDSWASIMTGRPSLGRTGPGITVQSPRISDHMDNAQYLSSLRLLPIIHNVEFCKIATRVQDLLAAHSIIGFEELLPLDAELEKWHDDLPPILRDVVIKRKPASRRATDAKPESGGCSAFDRSPYDFSQPLERDNLMCPEILKTPRAVMHWRYQNLRILMHRPWLLATALRRAPYSKMSTEEKLAVARCRIVAGQTIVDIDRTCQESLIAGWNAVWMMYQAVMVPLVSLFSVLAMPPEVQAAESPAATPRSNSDEAPSPPIPGSDGDVARWRQDVETSIGFFDRMQPWSVAARKSRDVVQKMYNATTFVSEHHAQLHQQQQEILKQRRQSVMMTMTTSHQDQDENQNSLQTPVDARHPGLVNGFAHDFVSSSMPGTAAPLQDETLFGAVPSDLMAEDTFMPSATDQISMNNFWDEMMWETFEEDLNGVVVGIEQTDWWQHQVQQQVQSQQFAPGAGGSMQNWNASSNVWPPPPPPPQSSSGRH
ncbi:Lactose regulatory LAC9 [Lecanosticta acicola]|uniref:Lactose regulatory LAC9 n=1 Tax=Lecanosticta acicola TaxID=111012 RepID=A0AAI8YXC7_9PEZI|nr:Lactose regulatory LAC9 [Lecanosticta acicola]